MDQSRRHVCAVPAQRSFSQQAPGYPSKFSEAATLLHPGYGEFSSPSSPWQLAEYSTKENGGSPTPCFRKTHGSDAEGSDHDPHQHAQATGPRRDPDACPTFVSTQVRVTFRSHGNTLTHPGLQYCTWGWGLSSQVLTVVTVPVAPVI